MSGLATDLLGRRARRADPSRRGNILVGVMLLMFLLMGFLYITTSMSTLEVNQSQRAADDLRSQYMAEAGVERAVLFLGRAVKNTSIHDPLKGLTQLFATEDVITPYVGTVVMDGTRKAGAYSIRMTLADQTPTSVSIQVESTGYVPDAPDAAEVGHPPSWRAVRTTVQFRLAPSEVFDYGYFINNWGWFYGDTIYCNGNARSNAQFDSGGYAPTITGQPLYDAVSWDGSHATLTGYKDDNKDGLLDGNDGGTFAGWDIVNASKVKGNGGKASNQHDFQGQVSMPNLSDLSAYEASALEQGGTIKIAGVTYCSAIYGDDASEHEDLYLVGTLDNPIELSGPVVVRGDLIISGYVTGQGAIYSGGNVYCPGSVRYKNGPTTARPASSSQADTETWLATNWDKDFLGLFARENVVVGDFTDSTWQYYESYWMSQSINGSAEDAGADGLPNTGRGKDGIAGTADDDVLEGDGIFTTEVYSEEDGELGLIPPGKKVGDVIPGTGEDIDGDGVYDGQTKLSDVVLTTPLDTAHWGGNMPGGGIGNYHDIASMKASRLDAVFYTNHSFCYVVLGGDAAQINGAMVCRNENIVYGTPSVAINYDCRLLGGSSGRASKLLPIEIQPPVLLRWTQLEADPNRYVVEP